MIESWTAAQGILDHWAFLDREGQTERRHPRVVLDAEPVLDLLERVNCNAVFAHDALGRRAATELVAILSEHGRLSS